MWCTIIAGIVFILIGIFLLTKPKLFWTLTEQWKSYAADDPSDFYLMSTKFGGACFVVAGAGIILLCVILELL